MLSFNELEIVHYYHPDCIPLRNIMRLPREEAFFLAGQMAERNPGNTAFYRFADFENYYALRLAQDRYLHDKFISLGGTPKEEHPLSFVLAGSDYLHGWFGGGKAVRLQLAPIAPQDISFTFGDSGSAFQKQGAVTMYTKQMLMGEIAAHPGGVDAFLKEIETRCHYIEVQLWNDGYIQHLL